MFVGITPVTYAQFKCSPDGYPGFGLGSEFPMQSVEYQTESKLNGSSKEVRTYVYLR